MIADWLKYIYANGVDKKFADFTFDKDPVAAEMAAIDSKPRSATAKAIGPVSLLAMAQNRFLDHMRDNSILVEICLSSNLQSCVVEDLTHHPFRFYMKEGIRLCLNTDNTLFTRTTPTRELRLAVDTFDLTLLETENLLINGFKSAFLPERIKGEMILEALQTFASLRDKFGLDQRMAPKP